MAPTTPAPVGSALTAELRAPVAPAAAGVGWGAGPGLRIRGKESLRELGGRSVLVRRLQPIPVECVARGYLVGSG